MAKRRSAARSSTCTSVLLQKRVAREGIGRGQDRQRADVARVPAHARFEPQAAAGDVEEEQADESAPSASRVRHIVSSRIAFSSVSWSRCCAKSCSFSSWRAAAPRVERASVLDRGRRLRAEGRQQLDVAGRDVVLRR